MESARQQINQYDGKFEADWLLNSFSDDVWETKNRGREETIDGKLVNSVRFDWRIQLADGHLLTDQTYEVLLTLMKKIAFFMRSGLIAGTSTPRGWRNNISRIIMLARWTVIHKEKFHPAKYGFRLLDQPSVEWLFKLLAEGGWFHALQIPQRIVSVAYQGVHGSQISQNILSSSFSILKD